MNVLSRSQRMCLENKVGDGQLQGTLLCRQDHSQNHTTGPKGRNPATPAAWHCSLWLARALPALGRHCMPLVMGIGEWRCLVPPPRWSPYCRLLGSLSACSNTWPVRNACWQRLHTTPSLDSWKLSHCGEHPQVWELQTLNRPKNDKCFHTEVNFLASCMVFYL